MKNLWIPVLSFLAVFGNSANAQTTSDFEQVLMGSDTVWNGSDESRGFVDGAAYFFNDYNSQWGSWGGFSVSKTTDTVTGSWSNQYSSISGAGAHGSAAYAVVYGPSSILFTNSTLGDTLQGLMINNSTYAGKKIAVGDNFTKKFGGVTGNDPDFFSITFYGYNQNLELVDSLEFFLADFRFSDNTKDYILKDWTWVDLSKLGRISYLDIAFNSSDKGQFGINTPTYACIDSLVYNNSSSDFKPLANYLYEYLPFNSAVRNYNPVKAAINPGGSADDLTASIVIPPTNGQANALSDSIISYEPNANFNGVDSIWFAVCNKAGLCDTGLIQVIVNDAPIANEDTLTYGSDGVVLIDVLANDVDEQKNELRLSLMDTAQNGTASVIGQEIEYISNSGFEGFDTLTYLICDPFGFCDSGKVYLNIRNELSLVEHSRKELSIYPNPTKGFIQFNVSNEEIRSVTICDITGKQIDPILVNGGLDISGQPNGVYVLTVESSQSTTSFRILKF